MQDQLIECRKCGSPYCYESFHQNKVDWKCLSCGFVSNSYMMPNTDFVLSFEQTIARLHVDMKFLDSEGFLWYPITYDAPGKGMIFADGTTKENWKWTVVPYVPVQPEEREKFKKKDGTYATHKTDFSKKQSFEQTEFPLAVEFLGVL